MRTNADMTIYNSYYDAENDCTRYKRTYLYGVNWQSTQVVSVDGKGLNSVDTLVILVPFSIKTEPKRTYIPPRAYDRLTDAERDNYFTFKADDKVVKGIIDKEITLIKELEQYDDMFTIDSVIPCDEGSCSVRHWEVGGK